MRIAVPTNDGISISEHFGRSTAFLVFDVESGQITNRETRPNAGCHSHGECASGPSDGHAGMAATLTGCDVVLSAGMGARAAAALQAAGISSSVVAAAGPAEEVVKAYLAGKLNAGSACSCSCHH